MPAKTESEQRFEEYLNERTLSYDFEPPIEGKARRPDYRLPWTDETVFLDVKEFERRTPRTGAGAYDPYPPVREKIEAARKKFREFKEHPCGLVLYDCGGGPPIQLDTQTIFGAMLGDLGFTFRMDMERGQAVEEPRTAFLDHGKMISSRTKGPQNTTLSAIIVLCTINLGYRRGKVRIAQSERELGRDLTVDELFAIFEDQPGATALRVVVHHNPFARRPLPKDLFTGAFDETWEYQDQTIQRTAAGTDLLSLEREENEAGADDSLFAPD